MSASDARYGRRRLYLMRHGHVDYFDDAVLAAGDHRVARLTRLGREQAAAAGVALREAALEAVVCSGLPRTRETAEAVLAEREEGLTVLEDLDLEELRGGTLRFASRADAAQAIHEQFAAAAEPEARMFGGEPFAEAQARAVRVITRLVLAPAQAATLVVAHEGVNRLILSWAVGAGLRAAPAFEQDPACVNVLDFDVEQAEDGAARLGRRIVKLVNATPYNWLKHGMSRTSLEALFAAD